MLRYFKKVEKTAQSDVPGLSLEEKEWANRELQIAVEKKAEKWSKYNDYTPEICAKIVRMAKAAKWLQAILDYKKVKWSTSTVFGQFS